MKECLPSGECHIGAGRESKEVEMAMCDKLPGLPVSLGGGKVVKKSGVRFSPERREG